MKRMLTMVLIFVIMLMMLPVGVRADSGVTSMSYTAIVSSDGSCEVTIMTTLALDARVEELEFPVPEGARDVALDRDPVRTKRSGQVRTVDLSDRVEGLVGEFTFRIDYELDNVLTGKGEKQVTMDLPMLSGFAYPVEELEFTVTLPGNVPGKPGFSSGYHQDNIELDLEYTVDGAIISGKTLKSLKDQETLTMSMKLDSAMFPDAPIEVTNAAFDDIVMIVCGALALLYWILFLRNGPVRRKLTATPPDGFSAGEIGSVVALQGANLHLMVFTWARLGYILIQLDRNSRVLLHKRMDMGNERSGFEQKLYKALFGKNHTVDTTSYRYAALCKKARRMSPEARSLLSKSSGNPMLFRLLGLGVSTFAGVAIGISVGAGAIAQWFWVLVFAVAALASGWYIQKWAEGLLLQNKRSVLIGLLLSVLWILIGILGAQIVAGIVLALSQLLVGLMAAYGGRHTKQGRQVQCQVAGLRHFLKTITPQQRKQITLQDPEYFHNMAPYALALGVDRVFAKRFGREKIDPCPYLTTGMDGHRSTVEWCELFRRALEAMETRSKRLLAEKFVRIIENIRKP